MTTDELKQIEIDTLTSQLNLAVSNNTHLRTILDVLIEVNSLDKKSVNDMLIKNQELSFDLLKVLTKSLPDAAG